MYQESTRDPNSGGVMAMRVSVLGWQSVFKGLACFGGRSWSLAMVMLTHRSAPASHRGCCRSIHCKCKAGHGKLVFHCNPSSSITSKFGTFLGQGKAKSPPKSNPKPAPTDANKVQWKWASATQTGTEPVRKMNNGPLPRNWEQSPPTTIGKPGGRQMEAS